MDGSGEPCDTCEYDGIQNERCTGCVSYDNYSKRSDLVIDELRTELAELKTIALDDYAKGEEITRLKKALEKINRRAQSKLYADSTAKIGILDLINALNDIETLSNI